MRMRADKAFKQVRHCGGKFSITTKTDPASGSRAYSTGFKISSAGPASLFVIYALPSGIPILTLNAGGMADPGSGDKLNLPFGFQVLVASDSHGFFGHQCQACEGYWRSRSAPAMWRLSCPYCGQKGFPHEFLTSGQRAFVAKFCDEAFEAVNADAEGTTVIDIDRIADEISKGADRPAFYYAEETQQRRFTCTGCGDESDITGYYGYCSCCGTRSELALFEAQMEAYREQLRADKKAASALCDLVSAFDSAFRQYARQLIAKVPMTTARKNRLDRLSFHNVAACAREFETVFDIKMLQGIDQPELLLRSFLRRHVYEHNGGVVDREYLEQTGDTTVRLHEAINETLADVFAVADMTVRMLRNIHQGFHDILPPEKLPIEYEQRKLQRLRSR